MADDRRFIIGWGIAVVLLGACGLLTIFDIIPGALAALGIFFALLGVAMAALSTMGPKEPMLSGGGFVLLVLGSVMAIIAYDLASAVVLLFIVLIIAGAGLVLAGLKGGK